MTILMVNCQLDVKKSKPQQIISGKRVAVFGLHIFELEKIFEYEETGKSDYLIVPIIGETSMFVLSHIIFSLKKERKRNHLSLSHADIKTPRNFNLKRKNDETHDFAMAILEREITFTDSVRPICIPRQVRTQGNGWANWVKAATRN